MYKLMFLDSSKNIFLIMGKGKSFIFNVNIVCLSPTNHVLRRSGRVVQGGRIIIIFRVYC